MVKTLTIKCEIQPKNTPTNWEFSNDVSGVEQLAMLLIVKTSLEKKINEILGK